MVALLSIVTFCITFTAGIIGYTGLFNAPSVGAQVVFVVGLCMTVFFVIWSVGRTQK